MNPSLNHCVNCGAELPSQDATCHRCDGSLRASTPASQIGHAGKGAFWRWPITLFMCALAVLCAYGLYDYHHAKTGLLAAFYTYISFPIGIFIPALWIFFPGHAAYLTVAGMGFWGMWMGFANLSARSFAALLAVVIGYTFLLFLDKRFPNLFPAKISQNSILIPVAFWSGWWLVMRENPVAYILGGGFMLYLTAGVMLTHWRPELGKRIGIKIPNK